MTPTNKSPPITVAIVFTAWTITSILMFTFLPSEWKWLSYIPLAFIVLAIAITAAIIVYQSITRNKRIESVYINHKRISCCQFCPMADVKDNIVNNSFPVVKCRETAKVCYQPMKIPRWCPYA